MDEVEWSVNNNGYTSYITPDGDCNNKIGDIVCLKNDVCTCEVVITKVSGVEYSGTVKTVKQNQVANECPVSEGQETTFRPENIYKLNRST